MEKVTLIDNLPPTKRKYFSVSVFRQILGLHRRHQAVIIDYPWFGVYFLPPRLLAGRRYQVRQPDVQFLRFKSFGKWYWPLMYVFERLVCRWADKVRFISEADKLAAVKAFGLMESRCEVEPFIPDGKRFYPTGEYRHSIRERLHLNEDECFLLFYGRLDYAPNRQAIDIIKRELIPRLHGHEGFRYTIVVCGSHAPPIEDDRIIYTGFVEHIEHYVQSCDVLINPVVSGGGVKTKVLEALACERPVVSTAAGAVGINVDNYPERLHLCNTHDWNAFVDEILSVGRP